MDGVNVNEDGRYLDVGKFSQFLKKLSVGQALGLGVKESEN